MLFSIFTVTNSKKFDPYNCFKTRFKLFSDRSSLIDTPENIIIVSGETRLLPSTTILFTISAFRLFIDKIKQEVPFLNRYTIIGGDRPDSLSQKLYGTTDHYWTFYLMNDDLRFSGWPVDTNGLLEAAISKYPNRTIVTADDIGALFPVGQVVEGTTSGTNGTIIKRNLDLGQLVIKTINGTKFSGGEQLRYTDLNGVIQILTTTSETGQYNAVHHYENTSGVQVDVDPHNLNTSGLIPITFRDRMEAKNDSLKQIITIRPDSIDTVVSEFNRMLKR